MRFRVDGVLARRHAPCRGGWPRGVISRIKIMAELDIAERRLPQDGRVGLVVDGRHVDLRVATLPTVHGESDRDAPPRQGSRSCSSSTSSAWPTPSAQRFEHACRETHGAVLVTGPTGSGKSTTLYAALQLLNTPEKNIITVEDPVEYRLTGSTRSRSTAKVGLTFAAGLRSMLRARPRHHHGRRDPRPRDGADRHRVGAHRPPGALHAAHQRRAVGDHAADRDGHRALPGRLGASTAWWPSAWRGCCARAASGARSSPQRCCARTATGHAWSSRPTSRWAAARCGGTGYSGRVGAVRGDDDEPRDPGADARTQPGGEGQRRGRRPRA